MLPGASSASAQSGRQRVAEGRVTRPGLAQKAPVPVPGQWVVLHRVGSDRAAPVDSVRSGTDGRFRIAYRASGAPDALYFVSSRYHGIAYFSPPLRAEIVRGGDADVIVYETTTDSAQLRLQGHHLVVSAPRGRHREVAEIFELDNGGTTTVVARDSLTPLWSTYLPPEADSVAVGAGDVGAGAVSIRRGRAELFAPMSPGVRQLVLTYLLPVDAFPVSFPMLRPTTILEVLAEERLAKVAGANLGEVAPASIEGRSFRRFIARDVPPSAVVRFDAPAPTVNRQSELRILAGVVAFAMALAIVVFARRRSTPAAASGFAPNSADALIGELAALDARFEKDGAGGEEARARYESARAELKVRIARQLAVEESRA